MKSVSKSELDAMLLETLEDQRLSRTEKRALREVFADMELDEDARSFVRHRVFALAREAIRGAEYHAVIDWVEKVIKLLVPDIPRDASIAEAHFSPGDECRHRITRLLERARSSVDICVFTITDNQLARPIREAHERGVAVRVITDNDKAEDRGSDAYDLAREGVPLRVDRSEHHMHHKYALFDKTTLVTGSYNWTRSAARHNQENIIVSDDPRLVKRFQASFDEFWEILGASS